jgi:peptide deformylase
MRFNCRLRIIRASIFLERILGKYWADAEQVVILKIDTEKLPGRMAFETNPGGSAKYYHLYDGHIPFASVAESRVIYRDSDKKDARAHSLKVVQVGEAVLRQAARPLSEEEILSPEIQKLIEEMKVTMREAPGVGLAAPQIGLPIQLVVVEDMDHSHLTAEQLAARERSPFPLHVIINPKIYVEGEEKATFFEGCLSVPDCCAVVSRARVVRVECLNEKAEPVVLQAKGWYARILQHEIDHLHGTLFIDRADLRTMTTGENYVKFWQKKSVAEAQQSLSSR